MKNYDINRMLASDIQTKFQDARLFLFCYILRQGRRLGVLGGANALPQEIFCPPSQGILGGGGKIS